MTATEILFDNVILVDENDNEVGTASKLLAHQNNLLHRAFSIFIFRETENQGSLEILLQQRAFTKYHSPGLWTNACCSHPRKGETIVTAAKRRLEEELNINTPLKTVGWFYYNAHFSNGLSEHEIDHVLVGMVEPNQDIFPHPEEVEAVRWIGLDELQAELETIPQQFTSWFSKAFEVIKSTIFLKPS